MERPHRKVQGERTLPEFHFDLCFPGGEEGEGTLTVLVVRERKKRMTLATVIPSKSASNFVTRRFCSFIRELGYEHADIIVKCDEENSIKALGAGWSDGISRRIGRGVGYTKSKRAPSRLVA